MQYIELLEACKNSGQYKVLDMVKDAMPFVFDLSGVKDAASHYYGAALNDAVFTEGNLGDYTICIFCLKDIRLSNERKNENSVLVAIDDDVFLQDGGQQAPAESNEFANRVPFPYT